jgi:hypothetical protein
VIHGFSRNLPISFDSCQLRQVLVKLVVRPLTECSGVKRKSVLRKMLKGKFFWGTC